MRANMSVYIIRYCILTRDAMTRFQQASLRQVPMAGKLWQSLANSTNSTPLRRRFTSFLSLIGIRSDIGFTEEEVD